jgi:lipid-binding SYLF domain-containing protein
MNGRLIPIAFVSALLLSPAAALAASPSDNGARATQRSTSEQHVLKDATNAVNRAKSDTHFRDLMKQAKGVFVLPNLVKGAAIVGAQGGEGVLLARHGSQWSDPAFYNDGSISIGAQAGGEAGPVIMLLMSDKALNDFIDNNNFSLNANAGLTIVDYATKTQGGVGKGDIVVWSGQKGALAGASISGGDITQDKKANDSFYGRSVTAKDIIDGHVRNAQANTLRDALPS